MRNDETLRCLLDLDLRAGAGLIQINLCRRFLDKWQVADYPYDLTMGYRGHAAEGHMGLGGWILLGIVASALGTTFALVLMRMASDEDRAARHEEKRLFPHSDVSITNWMPTFEH